MVAVTLVLMVTNLPEVKLTVSHAGVALQCSKVLRG